jgi:hypothetical protein
LSWGSGEGIGSVVITSDIFSWSAREFEDLNHTSFVVLFGGEINAELEHQAGQGYSEES